MGKAGVSQPLGLASGGAVRARQPGKNMIGPHFCGTITEESAHLNGFSPQNADLTNRFSDLGGEAKYPF
jgi:hypothetical protein